MNARNVRWRSRHLASPAFNRHVTFRVSPSHKIRALLSADLRIQFQKVSVTRDCTHTIP